jgi:O-antigen/teichoic acid export membrane protein
MGGNLKRSAVWMLGSHAVRLLVGFFLGTWVARALGPAEFGILATGTAAVAVAHSVAELGIRQFLLKEVGRRRLSGPVIAGTILRLWAVTGTLAALGFVGWNAITSALPWPVMAAMLVPLLCICLSVHNNWEESCQRPETSARNQLIGYLTAATARLAALIMVPRLAVIAWTFSAEGVLGGLLGLRSRSRHGAAGRWHGRVAQIVLSRGLPLFLSQAGMLLLLRMDTLMVEEISGRREAGIYGAAVRLSELCYALSPMLITLLLPRLGRLWGQRDEVGFRRLSAKSAGLGAMAGFSSAIGLWLVGGLCVQWLFGSEYLSSVPVLLIHCVAAIPFFLGEWRAAVLVALDKPAWTARFAWLAAALNFSLNLLWIPEHGALGAAWATLVSYFAGGMLATWLVPELRWMARLQTGALLEPLRCLVGPARWWREMKSAF